MTAFRGARVQYDGLGGAQEGGIAGRPDLNERRPRRYNHTGCPEGELWKRASKKALRRPRPRPMHRGRNGYGAAFPVACRDEAPRLRTNAAGAAGLENIYSTALARRTFTRAWRLRGYSRKPAPTTASLS